MKSFIKLFAEFGPLVAFFMSYKFYGLPTATATVIVLSIVSVIITYSFEKKISMLPLFTALILLIFGSLSLFTGNMLFIKIKPTVINLLFATILIGGALAKKPVLKYLLEEKMSLTDKAWIIFSIRWGCFFAFLAIMNEIIWRNFPEDLWVTFKVFGIISCTMIFMLTQIPFINSNKLDHK